MSDQQPPPDGPANPYGAPPPPSNPYGAPPPPANPYGTPYAGAPGSASARDPESRPGTVTAAAVITLLFAVLSALGFGAGLIGLLVARQELLDELRQESELSSYDGDQILTISLVVLAVLLVWSISAIVLSVLVLRRSNVARILLVISSALTALLSLIAILSLVSAITLIAGIAVIVLLFTGGAGDWFSRKGSPPQPPMGTTAY